MNILLTSAGRRSYIVDYFKNVDGVDNVYVANSVYTIACERADGYFIAPLIYSDNYIPSIISYCQANNISIIQSLFDIDLLILAKNKEKFEEHNIQLILASADFVEVCNDKYKTYLFAKQIGLKTPETYIDIEDLKTAINLGKLHYPIIIKPRWGMASMDIFIADNEEELNVLSNKAIKGIFSSYLKYESNCTKDKAVVYQEMLHGYECGLDVVNDLMGNYVATCAKQKIAMRSGETDLGRTLSSHMFENFSRKISLYSKHQGICSVDCFVKGQDIYLLEMNCRISGHYPLSHLAGFNYPQLLIDWLHGKPTNQELLNYQIGLLITKDIVPCLLQE